LKDVKAPIQLWASQFGGDGVLPETMPALAHTLPNEPDYHFVAEAGHFAFLAPCSPKLAKAASQLCVDDKSFDRVTFHRALDQEVLQFFEAHLN
jgi:predicted dienelactone hydrolase